MVTWGGLVYQVGNQVVHTLDPLPLNGHDHIATHLGLYTVTYHIEVDNSDPTAGVGVESLTFVAANGDRIYANGTGLGGPTEIPGVNRIVEQYTITGGTGRFAGATGSFTMERLVNLGSGYSSGDFDGQIIIP